MLQSFLAFLGAEPGEEKPMLLLLGKGFCMGIFIATYTVGAETLFLSTVGAEYLDKAFFAAGFLGIFSAGAYVQLQKRVKFSSLVSTNTLLIFLFVGALLAAFLSVDLTAYTDFQYLPFILFAMSGPVISITILGFWGAFGRIWDLKQAKRIIGGIDTGQLVATMIAFFSIPVLTLAGIINETIDLLFISTGAAFGTFVFTKMIVKNFDLNAATQSQNERKQKSPVSYLDLVKNKYLRMLCVFIIFSMASAVFASFVYLSATEIMYPDETELRTFLSFTNGTIMVLSFVIQSFINDIIIGKYGLRVALIVMPVVLGLFVLGAIFSGHLFVYDVKTEEYIFFFIFMVVGKVFTSSLRDALENPAFKLFFLPFNTKIRFDIQSRVEGVVNEVAVLAAGALQIVLGSLAYFKLIHYSYFIMGLAAMIIYYAGRLYKEYKIQLNKTMEEQKSKLKSSAIRNEHHTVNVLKKELRRKDLRRVVRALKVMERIEPLVLDDVLLDLIKSEHKALRLYAYQKLGTHQCVDALKILATEIRHEKDEEVRKVGLASIQHLKSLLEQPLNEKAMKKKVRSTQAQDRIFAARSLALMRQDKFIPFLIELLRDMNPAVRRAAIISAGRLKRPEFWSILVENLHLPAYSCAADAALEASGEAVFHTLDPAFYKTRQHLDTMLRIVQILGKVGGRQATKMLWKKIDFPDKNVFSELLLALSHIGFQAQEGQVGRIKVSIENVIADLTWNIKTRLEIPKQSVLDIMLIKAFDEENKRDYERFFRLLSMVYNPQNIKLVRDNIELGTTEGVSFGIEMLGIFSDEMIRPKLTAILDDDPTDKKLEKLHNFYPPEYFEDYTDLLLQIVNRDYNNLNKWTKCLALYRLAFMPDYQVTDDLLANLFNPDPVLVQTAAAVIYKVDKEMYHKHTLRLESRVKKALDRAIVPPVFKSKQERFHQKRLFIERAIFLKKTDLLKDISGILLLDLAKRMEEVMVKPEVTLVAHGQSDDIPVYIVLKGSLLLSYPDGRTKTLKKGDIIGHQLILPTDRAPYRLVTQSACLLFTIEKDELYDTVSRKIEMVHGILTLINEDQIKEEHDDTLAFSA